MPSCACGFTRETSRAVKVHKSKCSIAKRRYLEANIEGDEAIARLFEEQRRKLKRQLPQTANSRQAELIRARRKQLKRQIQGIRKHAERLKRLLRPYGGYQAPQQPEPQPAQQPQQPQVKQEQPQQQPVKQEQE